MGVAAVESLFRIGNEAARDLAEGGPAVAVGVACHQFVQRHAVLAHHVLHVGSVLQAAFDFKRAHPGIGKLLQPVEQLEVAQRQEGLVADQRAPGGVLQVVQRTAGLDALAPVGAAAVQVSGETAVAAVAHAERSVHEELHLATHGGADFPHRGKRDAPFQDDAAAAEGVEMTRPLHVAYGALGGGVHGDVYVLKPQQTLLAEDEGVYARILRLKHLGMHLLPLVVVH